MTDPTPAERLAEAVRIHDDDPWAARALVTDLPFRLTDPSDLARLTWLATHAIGNLLKRWPEAQILCSQAIAVAGPPRADMLRNLAVAATLAGDPLEAWQAEMELSALLGVPPADGTALIRLLVIEQSIDKDKLAGWLPVIDGAVAQAEQIQGPPDLVRFLAIAGNNIASAIIESIPAPVDETARVVERVARLSHRAWLAVGSWLNHERAHYLMALVFNATGKAAAAADAAREGLAIIAAHEPAPIDQCFLTLALARALKTGGDPAGSTAARAEAAELATRFDDPYWQAEYAKRDAALG